MAFASIKFGKTTVEIPDRHTKWKDCTCKRLLELDDDTQLLQCADCGKYTSAFTYLKGSLGELGILQSQKQSIRAEIDLKHRVLDGIKRDITNSRAKLRRLSKP